MTERIVCTRCAIISRGFVGNCEHVQEAVAAAEVERLKRPSDLKPEDWVTAVTAKKLLKEVNDARLQIREILDGIKLSHDTELKCACVGVCLLERYGHGRGS